MNLGKRLKQEREALGLTQTELAARIPGLSQQQLAALETRDSMTSQIADLIADALGVSLRWLLYGKGRKEDLDWPFKLIDRRRWDACNDEERGFVQAAFSNSLRQCESARADAGAKHFLTLYDGSGQDGNSSLPLSSTRGLTADEASFVGSAAKGLGDVKGDGNRGVQSKGHNRSPKSVTRKG